MSMTEMLSFWEEEERSWRWHAFKEAKSFVFFSTFNAVNSALSIIYFGICQTERPPTERSKEGKTMEGKVEKLKMHFTPFFEKKNDEIEKSLHRRR